MKTTKTQLLCAAATSLLLAACGGSNATEDAGVGCSSSEVSSCGSPTEQELLDF